MFGREVRAHRMRLGLSQEDVARRAGVDVKTIGNIEAGRTTPRLSTVRLLAEALEISDADRDRFYGLASPAAAADADRAQLRVPAQLPLAPPNFIGRSAQLYTLDALADATAERPTAVIISAVWGTAGVGKTALALHWAHRIADRFPDGQLYVNLHGFDPTGTPLSVADALTGLLDALGAPAQSAPVTVEVQAARFRSLLAGRRVLLVLDNARDADQVRPLLPGTPGCLAVITSRNQLTSLVAAEGAQPIPVDLLTAAEAHELLTRRLGAQRVAAEPDAVNDIVNRCARLPLALAIVAALAATQPNRPLATLAGDLCDNRVRLDPIGSRESTTDLRAVFACSYHVLSRDAARLFRFFGLHPGPDITASAAASLAGVSVGRVRPILTELTRTHLVSQPAADRYAVHDLLRAYAAEQVDSHDTASERHVALHRLLDHYAHSAHAANRLLNPGQDRTELAPPQPGVTPETPDDHAAALAWFSSQHHALIVVTRQAAAAGFDMHAWHLAWFSWTFLERRGHWNDWVTTQELALSAADRLGDPGRAARSHRSLAGALIRLGRGEEAEKHLRDALHLFSELDDRIGLAHTHANLSWLFGTRGHFSSALEHGHRALELFGSAGHRGGQARTLNAIGAYHAQMGEYDRAIVHCQQALALHQETGDPHGEATAMDNLGEVNRDAGNYEEAITWYRRAVDLHREMGDRYGEAGALVGLGTALHADGDEAEARATWREALVILDELGHPDAEAVRTKLSA